MDLVCIKRLDRTELDWKSDIKAVENDSNSDRVLCINWDRCLKCFFLISDLPTLFLAMLSEISIF